MTEVEKAEGTSLEQAPSGKVGAASRAEPSIADLRRQASGHAIRLGAGIGLIYGVLLQLLMRAPGIRDAVALMTVGMLFFLPAAMGFTVVMLTAWQLRKNISWSLALFAPYVAIGPSLILSLVVGWEGAFCLMFAAPIFLVMSSLGGLLAKLIHSERVRRTGQGTVLSLVLLLPLVSGFMEARVPPPDRLRRVYTEVAIAAPPQVVWPEITRVRTILPAELPKSMGTGFFYRLGFPRPIEATLSHEGIGGVRHASFAKGLLFIETVTDWTPLNRLSFQIKADAQATRLDPHVVVGGQYFDVLQGTYEIAPGKTPNTVTLRLWSDTRISTHFNFYAGFLGDLLMRDIQDSILYVIKKRCEAADHQG